MRKLIVFFVVLVFVFGGMAQARRTTSPTPIGIGTAVSPTGPAQMRVVCRLVGKTGIGAGIYVAEIDANDTPVIVDSGYDPDGNKLFDIEKGKDYIVIATYTPSDSNTAIEYRLRGHAFLENVSKTDNWVIVPLETVIQGAGGLSTITQTAAQLIANKNRATKEINQRLD